MTRPLLKKFILPAAKEATLLFASATGIRIQPGSGPTNATRGGTSTAERNLPPGANAAQASLALAHSFRQRAAKRIADRFLPSFNALLVRKRGGELQFLGLRNYENRNESTARCIFDANQITPLADCDWFLINTDDFSSGDNYRGLLTLAYSSSTNNYKFLCPDFIFDHWRQVQIHDYEATANELSNLGRQPPSTDLLGWRGAMTHPNRRNLLKFTSRSCYDIEEIVWDRSDPNKLTCRNYLGLQDSVRKWRYLIDVEGRGYSGRVKLLLFSRRVLFLQDRPAKEWYYPSLKPWIHYVPVKPDLSDLPENLERVKRDRDLESRIAIEANSFAQKHLSRQAAYMRWAELFSRIRDAQGA
jgi:hypothetical protein